MKNATCRSPKPTLVSLFFIVVFMYFFIFNNLWIQALLEMNWSDQFWENYFPRLFFFKFHSKENVKLK